MGLNLYGSFVKVRNRGQMKDGREGTENRGPSTALGCEIASLPHFLDNLLPLGFRYPPKALPDLASPWKGVKCHDQSSCVHFHRSCSATSLIHTLGRGKGHSRPYLVPCVIFPWQSRMIWEAQPWEGMEDSPGDPPVAPRCITIEGSPTSKVGSKRWKAVSITLLQTLA